MPTIPGGHIPPSRVHPSVVRRVAAQDKNFTKHYLSGSTNLSWKGVLYIATLMLTFFILLGLMG